MTTGQALEPGLFSCVIDNAGQCAHFGEISLKAGRGKMKSLIAIGCVWVILSIVVGLLEWATLDGYKPSCPFDADTHRFVDC